MASRIEEIIEKLGTPIAEKLGYELVDVEYRKEGARWVLRCYIDSENGVGINECQCFSEMLSKVLDGEDPIPGSYLLEVSSPGVERLLKKEQHFLRFTGKKAEIRLRKPINQQKVFRGELLGLKEGEHEKLVRIKINDQIMEIPLTDVAKAKIVWEL